MSRTHLISFRTRAALCRLQDLHRGTTGQGAARELSVPTDKDRTRNYQESNHSQRPVRWGSTMMCGARGASGSGRLGASRQQTVKKSLGAGFIRLEVLRIFPILSMHRSPCMGSRSGEVDNALEDRSSRAGASD
jgi:hypothetical protein